MAATSIADKLAKLEKKIAKRQATIAEEQTQLDKELAEYDRLYLTALQFRTVTLCRSNAPATKSLCRNRWTSLKR